MLNNKNFSRNIARIIGVILIIAGIIFSDSLIEVFFHNWLSSGLTIILFGIIVEYSWESDEEKLKKSSKELDELKIKLHEAKMGEKVEQLNLQLASACDEKLQECIYDQIERCKEFLNSKDEII